MVDSHTVPSSLSPLAGGIESCDTWCGEAGGAPFNVGRAVGRVLEGDGLFAVEGGGVSPLVTVKRSKRAASQSEGQLGRGFG